MSTGGHGLPTNEYLSLKEISETLDRKIDSIQSQIKNITPKPNKKGGKLPQTTSNADMENG